MSTQARIDLLTTRIDEAEQALHDLMIGDKTVVVFRVGGNRMQYNKPDIDKLRSYIEEMKNERSECEALLGQEPTTPRRRAVGVVFQ